ncbi:TetR/AcrR family transcriptional regulator [Streptomyces sp. Da 82-17]|uniref:TetR/AcrR family transcriptional regulator n=1 Tax=Streptomyces sp. Da 82-17 TaxID=3377116 RepID=UPI0038D50C90
MPGSSLNERRKAATRRDIAHTAAALFVERGLRATRAEDIAREAGVSPRTFFRYFATKEESVAPVFAEGTQRWVEAVRAAPAELSVPDALILAASRALDPAAGALDAAAGAGGAGGVANAESLEWVRSLLRMAEEAPALRSVWNDACFAAEQALLDVLAERLGTPRREVSDVHTDEVDAADVDAAGASGAGAGGSGAGAGGSGAGAGGSVPSGLRLAAAVASTAIRVSVERWAATDAPADGPLGPGALAARNVESLREFPWSSS